MGALSSKVGVVVEDLKSSWYFRLWLLFWIVCAALSFGSLIVLGSRSSLLSKHSVWESWVESATSMNYPQFSFFLADDESTNTLTDVVCTRGGGLILHKYPCANGLPYPGRCVMIDGTGVEASQLMNNLRCTVNLTSPSSATKIMGFNIVNDQDFGTNVLWIAPSQNSEIQLEASKVTSYTTSSVKTLWRKVLFYLTTVVETGTTQYYEIAVKIGNFNIIHFQEDSPTYVGWMAVGEIGGFAFFCVILHTLVMGFFGLFLENNSKFLKGSAYTELS